MQVLTFSQARADLKQTMDEICADHEPVVVTRQRGEPVVMLSLADYRGLEETLHLLSSRANATRLQSSMRQLKNGKAFFKELTIHDEQEAEQ